VEIGSTVIGPGGLLGRVNNTSLFTSSVTLITSPESKVGVWVDRTQINGLLVGLGDDYPSLILYSKDADIKVGDFVSSSPASSLLPPNIPIGIVQSIDETSQSKKTAKILLLAKPNLIDWVQILKENIRIGMRDGKTHIENIEVDKKILEAGHHHGSTYYEHLAFLKAIESNSDPEVSLEDGLIAVAMGEAAEKSIKQGRLINLEEIIN